MDEKGEDDAEEEDHEDIELMVKEMAALKKVCEYIYAYARFCHLILVALVNGNVGLSVIAPLWSSLEYLYSYQMDCNEIW